ncbi:hypothetical protein J7U46_12355 [Pelomonas sp. V22]|uniref:hypothetical protein n=1 Tax=Pelomonas sp. V22 TaxID=2822139 RepID=UPI0024A7E908|nr:hypothetical protein [Pelomonas sp. V22]MDI4633842.1 hypothetical protein [Pelomonas sp. V22]
MKIKWDEGFDLSVFETMLTKGVEASGRGVHHGPGSLEDCVAVARTMLRFDPDLAWETKTSIISKAVNAQRGNPDHATQSVLRAVQRDVRLHLAKPETPFILVTTIGIASGGQIPKVSIHGCTISFPSKLPSRFLDQRTEAFARGKSCVGVPKDDLKQWVRIRVDARSSFEAGTKALDALDLLRGELNLFANTGWRKTYGGPQTPVNQVRLGPLHTLHRPNGDNTDIDLYWYDPQYTQGHSFLNLRTAGSKVLSNVAIFRRKMVRLPYRATIEDALIRYARCLDTNDLDASVVKLWGVLELLTGTGRDSYEKTIRRASFIFSDGQRHRLVLEHLRRYRNRSVHAGKVGEDMEIEVFQLKKYVEHLLRFHVLNNFAFQSFNEACAFLDHSHNAAQLKKQIATLRAALKFLG